jgi:hypothetical protein
LDGEVSVAAKERGEAIAGIPADKMGEVAVGVVLEVVPERVGDLPFFDSAPAADM